RHPWTNGQVERDATTKIYHYDDFHQLETHLQEFIFAYNLSKRLKTLKFKTPFDFLIEQYKIMPKVFYKNPLHYLQGLYK
ncbi:MAG: hypothetical protein ACI9W5_000516, partial [Ulvibacter sp.]